MLRPDVGCTPNSDRRADIGLSAINPIATEPATPRNGREWDGLAVLPPLTALAGASKHGEHIAMSQRTDAVVVSTIGIDTGKNTLHLIGLDDKRTIVLP